MAKNDRLADVERTHDKHVDLTAQAEKTGIELEEKRQKIRDILGLSGSAVSFAGLSFSQPMVVVGAAAAGFMAGFLVVSPIAGLMLAAVAVVGGIGWFNRR